VREKYCWLVTDKPNERGAGLATRCQPQLTCVYFRVGRSLLSSFLFAKLVCRTIGSQIFLFRRN
jgi:hypothetical protein